MATNKTVEDAYKKLYDEYSASGNKEGAARTLQVAGSTSAATTAPSGEPYGYGALSTQAAGTASGSVSAPSEDIASSYITDINRQQQKSQIDSLRGVRDSALAALDAQEAGLEPTYNAARDRTANNTSQAKMNFNEMAAATGRNSGASGQAELSRQNNYARSMSDIDVGEANAKAQIALQRTQLKISSAAQIASATASNNAALATQLLNEYYRKQDQLAASESAAEAQANKDRDFTYGAALDTAKALADVGNYSGYEALGWTPEQIASANAGYAAKAKPSGGGTNKNFGTVNDPIYKNAMAMLNADTDPTQVINYLYSTVDDPDGTIIPWYISMTGLGPYEDAYIQEDYARKQQYGGAGTAPAPIPAMPKQYVPR